MPTINQLSGLSQISGGDLIPVYVPNNGDARKVSISQLLEYFQQSSASPTMVTTIFSPVTGFNIPVPTLNNEQQWVLLQPVVTLASGTVTLPPSTQTLDGTEVLITTTQQITSFTLAPNGASQLYGVPSTLAAQDNFRMRFARVTNSWYRIG
jgi:hypothetical protein